MFINQKAVELTKAYLTHPAFVDKYISYFSDWLYESIHQENGDNLRIIFDEDMPLEEFLMTYGRKTPNACVGNAALMQSFAVDWEKESKDILSGATALAAMEFLRRLAGKPTGIDFEQEGGACGDVPIGNQFFTDDEVNAFILSNGLMAARESSRAELAQALSDLYGNATVREVLEHRSDACIERAKNKKTIEEQFAKYTAQLEEYARTNHLEQTTISDMLDARYAELELAYPYKQFEWRVPYAAYIELVDHIDAAVTSGILTGGFTLPSTLCRDIRAGMLDNSIKKIITQAIIDGIYFDDMLGASLIMKNTITGEMSCVGTITGDTLYKDYQKMKTDAPEPFDEERVVDSFTFAEQRVEDIKIAVWEACVNIAIQSIFQDTEKEISDVEANKLLKEDEYIMSLFVDTVAKIDKEILDRLSNMTLAQIYDLASPKARIVKMKDKKEQEQKESKNQNKTEQEDTKDPPTGK